MKSRKGIVAATAAVALLASACGSSNDNGSTAASPPPVAAGSATAESPATAPTASAEPTASSTEQSAGNSSAPATGAATQCKVPASGPLQFASDKAAWKPDFEAMNAASTADCDLSVTFTGYSDPAQYDAFIKQGFQTDSKPTLFTWHTGGQLKELVDQGLIAETTDLWKAAEANGDLPAGLIDNYTFDGKQYCVPLNVAYWVMYYNKKIFADNNLVPPKTWDEFIKIADTLVAKGIVPLHQMNIIFSFAWFQALLVGTDPAAYKGLETGATKYTDPAVVDATKKWYEMENKKYFIDPGVQTDPQTLLKTGKTAMAYFGTFFTGQLTSVGMTSDKDYGVFALPNPNAAAGKQQMVLETGPLCVGKGSTDEASALAYSAWWMTQGAQKTWSDKRGDISFNPKVPVTDPALSGLLKDQGNWEIQKRWLEATPNPIYTVADPLFGEFVTNPVPDATDMLTQIQAAADEYWAGQ